MATLVCYTAVFSVVTQHSQWGGALRDDTKNGCVADYGYPDEREVWKSDANYHQIRLDCIVGICWILVYNKTVITVLYKNKLCQYWWCLWKGPPEENQN